MYKYILVPYTDLCAFFWIKMTHSYLVERDLTLSCVVKNILTITIRMLCDVYCYYLLYRNWIPILFTRIKVQICNNFILALTTDVSSNASEITTINVSTDSNRVHTSAIYICSFIIIIVFYTIPPFYSIVRTLEEIETRRWFLASLFGWTHFYLPSVCCVSWAM